MMSDSHASCHETLRSLCSAISLRIVQATFSFRHIFWTLLVGVVENHGSTDFKTRIVEPRQFEALMRFLYP